MSLREPLVTSRLSLTPLVPSDLDELFALFSDPGTWLHLPAARHTNPNESSAIIREAMTSRTHCGFGQWAVRLGEDAHIPGLEAGQFVGIGGLTLANVGVWNLGYRFVPASWGHGLAGEVAQASMICAAVVNSTLPVTARILSNNPASSAVARRVGLEKVWTGRTVTPAAAGVTGEIYSNRAVTTEQLEWLKVRT